MRSLERTQHTGAQRDAGPGGGLNSKMPRLLNSAVGRAEFGCRTAHHPNCCTEIENTRPTLISAPPQAQDRLSAGSLRYLATPLPTTPRSQSEGSPSSPARRSPVWGPAPSCGGPALSRGAPPPKELAQLTSHKGPGGTLGPTPPAAPTRFTGV